MTTSSLILTKFEPMKQEHDMHAYVQECPPFLDYFECRRQQLNIGD